MNFFNFELISIAGVKFEDQDGDGVRDSGEPGLAGWTIFLDSNDNGVPDDGETSTVTADDGTYSFIDLGPGTYRVREVLQDGWVQVTANTEIAATSGVDRTDVDFGNFQLITLTGQKFHDRDGDGTKDADETGVAGVVIFIDTDGDGVLDSGELQTTTGDDGTYSLTGVGPGMHQLREVAPSGRMQTLAPAALQATSGVDVSGLDFGNFINISISGTKFNDLDGDGTRDTGESGLAGWTIFIDADNDGSLDSGETSTTTGSDGTYTLSDVGPGTHRVREVLQSGWQQTTANPSDIVATSGENVSGVDFGNFQLITISGQKFEDRDGDGVKDSGESGLSGWTIFLDTDDDDVLDSGETSTVTGSDGTYSFTNLGPGEYRVREVLQSGWTRTLPAASTSVVHVAESGRNLSDVDFGNFRLVTVSGVKFLDLNADGFFDFDEPGLPGWTIFLDADGNGSLDADEPSAVTDDDGNFTISDVGPGTYDLAEVLLDGFRQTTDVISFTVTSGTNLTEQHIGNLAELTAQIITDPFDPDQTALMVAGSSAIDRLSVSCGKRGAMFAHINGERSGPFEPTGHVLVFGYEGNDRLVLERCVTLPAQLDGGDGDDLLIGGRGEDEMMGGDGNDSMKGRGGDDTMDGGDGDDGMRGGRGADDMLGGDGNDRMRGRRGSDTIDGEEGDDFLSGGRGADDVFGGEGNDRIRAARGRDTVDGGDGADTVNCRGNRKNSITSDAEDTVKHCGADSAGDGTSTNEPVSANDSFTVNEDSTLSGSSVLDNDSGDPDLFLFAEIVSEPTSAASFTLNDDGTFTYTPAANFNGTDTFSYEAVDELDNFSEVATVTITVNSINDAPDVVADSYTVAANTILSGTAVLANDSDSHSSAASESNTPLTAQLVSNPSQSSSFTLNTDGTFTYTPVTSFQGTDSFTYRAVDSLGGVSVTATVTILVGVAAVADSYNAIEDTTLSGTSVLANDSDSSGLTLTAQLGAGPSQSSSFTLNTDGTFTYTPVANFNGTDSFTYQAVNSLGSGSNFTTVTITVAAVNDPPIVTSDSMSMNEDGSLTASVVGNISDAENNTFTVQLVSGPSNDPSFTLSSDGTFSYTPAANFNGTDSFTYQAVDSLGAVSNTATMTIFVTSVNDAPVAVADAYDADEDATLAGTSVLANDSDSHSGAASETNTPLTAQLVTQPSSATSFTLATDGTFTYIPAADFNGTDSFTYQAVDTIGGVSNTATVTITVASLNDGPVGAADGFEVNHDETLVGSSVLDNDSDSHNGAPSESNLSLTAVVGISPANASAFTLNSDGTFTYTPLAGFNGLDSFTYFAVDSLSGLSESVTVSITIGAVN